MRLSWRGVCLSFGMRNGDDDLSERSERARVVRETYVALLRDDEASVEDHAGWERLRLELALLRALGCTGDQSDRG
jgi:hypothetical protein